MPPAASNGGRRSRSERLRSTRITLVSVAFAAESRITRHLRTRFVDPALGFHESLEPLPHGHEPSPTSFVRGGLRSEETSRRADVLVELCNRCVRSAGENHESLEPRSFLVPSRRRAHLDPKAEALARTPNRRGRARGGESLSASPRSRRFEPHLGARFAATATFGPRSRP